MEKALWPVMLSVGIWHLGFSLYAPFVSLWVLRDLGHPSFFVLALTIALPNSISIIGIFYLSKLADMKGHLRELACMTAFAGSFQFLLLRFFANSAISFLLIALPLGMFTMAYYALVVSLATSICHPETKGRVSSALLLFASLGWFLGSLGAGRAFRLLGMGTVLIIGAIILSLAGCMILKSPNRPIPDASSDDASFGEETTNITNSSLISLLKRHQIQRILLVGSIVHFGTGGLMLLSTVYYVEGIGVSEDVFSYLNAVATLLAVPILLFMGRWMDSIGRRFFLRFGVSLYLVWFIIISLTKNPLISLLLWGIPLYAFLSPSLTAMMADVTTLSERSRGIGLLNAEMMLMAGFGVIAGGILVDVFDSFFILPLIALIFLPLALYLSFLIPETLKKMIPISTTVVEIGRPVK